MQAVITSLILAISARGAECEPSRLVYGRVDLNTPRLDPWYLKSLTSAGVSDIILPGYVAGASDPLTGPIGLWSKLSKADRDSILQLAASNSNKIHMQVEFSSKDSFSHDEITKACTDVANLGLDGIVFSNEIREDQASLCSRMTSKAIMIASPDKSIKAPSGVEHYILERNEIIKTKTSGDLLMLCDNGTCEFPSKISDDALIYLNVVPGLTDQYLETFLAEDLPHLNGIFDPNDRPSRSASSGL